MPRWAGTTTTRGLGNEHSCIYCGGTGMVKVATTDTPTGKTTITRQVCPACHGSGRQ